MAFLCKTCGKLLDTAAQAGQHKERTQHSAFQVVALKKVSGREVKRCAKQMA